MQYNYSVFLMLALSLLIQMLFNLTAWKSEILHFLGPFQTKAKKGVINYYCFLNFMQEFVNKIFFETICLKPFWFSKTGTWIVQNLSRTFIRTLPGLSFSSLPVWNGKSENSLPVLFIPTAAIPLITLCKPANAHLFWI